MKPVLMIHEFREEMLQLPLGDYTLTFDDGLYSQYYYFEQIQKFDTEKLFFISTDIVCNSAQSTEFPCCVTAHGRAARGNRSDYMTLAQIIELANSPNVRIGGHSHYHSDLTRMHNLYQQAKHIETDTELMLRWFSDNLGTCPTDFCYPYNDDFHGMYRTMLQKRGFTHFYGAERIAIESLL